MKPSTALIACIVFLAACTWVNTTPEGENVRVATAAEVSGCEKLGKRLRLLGRHIQCRSELQLATVAAVAS